MDMDIEGFLYPKFDDNSCINCHLCENVCPVSSNAISHIPLQSYAACNKDSYMRTLSSSGGVFFKFAEWIIEHNGVVFGVNYDNSWCPKFDYAEDIDGVRKFIGSKYVQAAVGNSYIQVKEFLSKGRLVLFCGTPCQVLGLYRFLRKGYDALFTIDFICHGVPSPGVWKSYLQYCRVQQLAFPLRILAKFVPTVLPEISNVEFRNKDNGWKDFNFKLAFWDGIRKKSKVLISHHRDNPYMRLFLDDVILRKSCYSCHAKGGRSGSDITIADFWNVHLVLPEGWDDNMGTSLVLINTSRGYDVIDKLGLSKISVDFDAAIQYNESWRESANINQGREAFFKIYSKKKISYDDYFHEKVNMHYMLKYLKRYLKKKYVKLKK